jgi:transcriptional regulator with XRE-family HTH domain
MELEKKLQDEIGLFIHHHRKEQNLTLVGLSELAFGHPNYHTVISKIERGKMGNFSVETLDKITVALGFDLRSVFEI